MPEPSYVQKLMRPPQPEAELEWRQAFTIEREGASPFSVSVRFKDGRSADGFAPSLYMRHRWLDQGSKTERIIWLFSNGGIYVEGQHLKRALDALEEGKLKRIQEQDTTEIALIESRNADVRKAADKEPIVSRVVVSPTFESLIETEENLGEIAKVMKGALCQ